MVRWAGHASESIVFLSRVTARRVCWLKARHGRWCLRTTAADQRHGGNCSERSVIRRRTLKARRGRGKVTARARRQRFPLQRIFPPHLEVLEERILLTTFSLDDYAEVSSEWFKEVGSESSAVATEIMAVSTSAPSGQSAGSLPAAQWIVRLTPEATREAGSVGGTEALLDSSDVDFSVRRGLGLPGQVLVEAPGQDPAMVAATLRAHPFVSSVERNRPIHSQLVPNDSPNWDHATSQWGLHNVGQTGGTSDADIDAPEAWDLTTGSSEVIVAVLDSGIDYTHPDLAANMWTNPGEIAGNGVDDDGNGQIDDIHGYDFVNGDGDPWDDHRHGTHVAGIIAAEGNNGQGVAGVSWSTQLMAVKILDENNAGEGDLSDAVAAINYVTHMRSAGVNVRVINASWGYLGRSSVALREAIEAAGEAGILFVAAAGNGDVFGRGIDLDAEADYGFYPASEEVDALISVAASDFNDDLTRFSNYGLTSVDIAAPGAGIYSTEPGDRYQSRYGTSMAAPHVSGVAALVWSMAPDAAVAEVREAIRLGADPQPELQDKLAWGGRLNAYGAVSVDTAAPQATLEAATDVSGPGGSEVLITVTYTDNKLVDVARLDAEDIVVTRLWDGHVMEGITIESKPSGDTASAAVSYRVPAPEGTWGTVDDGDYRIDLGVDQVYDTSFNDAASVELGTFNVDTTPGLIRVTATYDAPDVNPGDGVADDGTGQATLRAAIMEANALPGENTVRIPPGTYTLSIVGQNEDAAATGDLDVTDALVIRGAGADQTIIDGAGLDRLLDVLPNVTLEVHDATTTNGTADQGGGIRNAGDLTLLGSMVIDSDTSGHGGGLHNKTGATMTIEQSTIAGNSAFWYGGGIFNDGDLNIVNSTISDNWTSDGGGGGIANYFDGNTTLTNTTVHANDTATNGGGIRNLSVLSLKNTIVAGNTARSWPDLDGAIVSQGHNLIGDASGNSGWVTSDILDVDPLLGPLQDNGGRTLTHALLSGSPAIDTGDEDGNPVIDQRGIARPQNATADATATADIGAIERYYGEVHGILFRDDNPNGIREIREPGLPGYSVYLDLNVNGLLDTGEPVAVTNEDAPVSSEPDVVGKYVFHGVPPGSHRIAPVIEQGWEQTVQEPQSPISCVSHGWEVTEGNDYSYSSSISADGRYVAFSSSASNLVFEDTNHQMDVFVHDRQTGTIERVNVASDGTQANIDLTIVPPLNSAYYTVSISADGRYVAFSSGSTNLVAGDTNSWRDVFVHDTRARTTERVSVASDGSEANFFCSDPSISADGRFVVFSSLAANLVSEDTNNSSDVFLHDRFTRTTTRVSVASDGTQPNGDSRDPSISPDGRYIAFESFATNLVSNDTNAVSDIFVHDCLTGTTERVSVSTDGAQADSGSSTLSDRSGYSSVSISEDGALVAFESYASNLVPEDTNGKRDIFVRNRQTGSTQRVSISSGQTQANDDCWDPSISANGRFVAFFSQASNLVSSDTNSCSDIFVYDLHLGSTVRASISSDGDQADGPASMYIGQGYSSISADGSHVAFSSSASNLVPGETSNFYNDVYVHALSTGTTERMSGASGLIGTDRYSQSPDTSADGRFIVYASSATNIVPGDTNGASDIFVHDNKTNTTERVSVAHDLSELNSYSQRPAISDDGRYIAFQSFASNIVPDDTNGRGDIFVHDRLTEINERVSLSSDGVEADSSSWDPTISADGRFVAFLSEASNLVPGDTNSHADVFVYDRQTETIERVNVSSDGTQANAGPSFPSSIYSSISISADGHYVAFESLASNLVWDDANGSNWDIFVFDRWTRKIERINIASDGADANSFNSHYPSISADGRFVAFCSDATNLAEEHTDASYNVFVRDRHMETTHCISIAPDGSGANGSSFDPAISADGQYIVFASDASNLVEEDTNAVRDIIVHDRVSGCFLRVNLAGDGTQADSPSGLSAFHSAAISASGAYVAFSSWATNLVPGDLNEHEDIFHAVNVLAWQENRVMAQLVHSGEIVNDMQMSVRPLPGVIRGRAYHDLDRDGFSDASEPGLVDWTLYLDLDENQFLDSGEPWTTTDSHGEYAFSDLAPFDTYSVREVGQEFWIQTAPRLIDDGAWEVEIGAGTVATNVDFGNHYRGPGGQDLDVIAGRLFVDPNGNGIQDEGEAGLVDRTVYLDINDNGQRDAGEPQTTTVDDDPNTTDENEAGDYLFSGLAAGVYTVRAVGEADWLQTTPMENDLATSQCGDPQLGNSQYLATGDFDGDGDVDVVVVYGDAVAVLENDGDGNFSAPVDIHQCRSGALPYSIAVARLDEDDDLDLAISNYFTSDVTILLNNGDGTFDPASGSPIAVGYLPGSVAAGDLDGDGDTDLVVANEFDNNVTILRNNGLGQFTPDAGRLAVGGSPKSVVVGRFYDDGQDGSGVGLDVAVANYDTDNISIWLNNGQGRFTTRVEVLAGDGPVGLSAGDLDRDGDQDLVVTNLNSQNISVLRNNGFGSFAKLPDDLSAGVGVRSVVAVDMDHDTDADVIVTNGLAEGTLHFTLLRNLSKPGEILFGPPQSYGVGNLADWAMSFAVTAAQLNDDNGDGQVNGDDDVDVAIANGYADGVSVVLNDVAPGAHRVTLTGVDSMNRLDFGFRQPGFSVTPAGALVTSEAGDTAQLTVALRTRPNADVTLSFSSSDTSEGTVAPSSLTFTPETWNKPQRLTVTGVDDAIDDDDVVYQIIGSAAVSSDANYHGLLPEVAEVTNLDDDPQLLQVIEFEGTLTGFVVTLSQPLDTTVLNVVDDVQMVGNSVGLVRGSLVASPDGREVTFIQTGGVLASDTYTLTLQSGAAAWCDTTGQGLDGNADGVVTADDDYETTLAIEPPAIPAITVRLPDVTRGYGQPVNLPADDPTAGLPLTLSEGAGVSGLDLQLRYAPALLEISGFTLEDSVRAAGGQASLSWPAPGIIILTVSSPVSFASESGPLTLGAFTARVPDDAPYASKHVLDIRDLHLYDDAADPQEMPSLGDDAVHVAAYLGDTNGSGSYNAPDATLVQRLIGQLTAELVSFQHVDPRLLADVTLNAAIQANDTTGIQRSIGQVAVPTIPPLPGGLDPPPAGGPDPQVSIPRDLAADSGEAVDVPIRMEVTEAGGLTLSGVDLVIGYDATRLTVDDAQRGDVLSGAGFSGQLFHPQPGRLIYTASSATGTDVLPQGSEAILLTLSFTVRADAIRGPSAINLRSSLGYTTTALFANDLSALTLGPSPTNASDDPVDGVLTIGPAAPMVTGVYVGREDWEAAFRDWMRGKALGDADGYYHIPADADQLNTLPWSGLSAIRLTFSEDVDVTRDDLTVVGTNAGPVTATGFTYEAETFTGTWTFSGLAVDKFLLGLSEEVRATRSGLLLDGEYRDGGGQVASGDGVPGGDFAFRFNVLPGDVTNSGNVVASDVSVLASAFGSFAGGSDARYSPFVDFDGSGNVVAADVSVLASHFGQFLPSAEPVWPESEGTAARTWQVSAEAAEVTGTSYDASVELSLTASSSSAVPVPSSTSSSVSASAAYRFPAGSAAGPFEATSRVFPTPGTPAVSQGRAGAQEPVETPPTPAGAVPRAQADAVLDGRRSPNGRELDSSVVVDSVLEPSSVPVTTFSSGTHKHRGVAWHWPMAGSYPMLQPRSSVSLPVWREEASAKPVSVTFERYAPAWSYTDTAGTASVDLLDEVDAWDPEDNLAGGICALTNARLVGENPYALIDQALNELFHEDGELFQESDRT